MYLETEVINQVDFLLFHLAKQSETDHIPSIAGTARVRALRGNETRRGTFLSWSGRCDARFDNLRELLKVITHGSTDSWDR